MDYRSLDDQVREEGIKEGFQIGLKEGIEEGKKEKAKEVYNELIKAGFSHEKAHWIAYGDEENL